MKSSGLFLLIMFMLANRAYSIENDVKEVRKGKTVGPRYHFNHPPSAEYYNPIPVAVVYEDKDDYSGKSVITTESETEKSFKEVRKGKSVESGHYLNHPPLAENYNPIPVSVEYEDNNNYSVKSDITSVTKVEESVKNDKVSIMDNEKHYDTVTEHEQDTNATPEISIDNKGNSKLVAKPRILNNYQIPVAIVYESDSNIYQKHQKRKSDTSTESPKSRSNYTREIENSQKTSKDTTNLQPNTDTRVFKKRVEGREPVVPILEMESYVFSHNGNFHYSYEGGDGTKAYSEGKQKTIDDEAGEIVAGGFSYKDKEGNDISLTYTADENGYRPVGAHLPTPPPIPPAIARALEYLATATPEPVTKRPDKPKLVN